MRGKAKSRKWRDPAVVGVVLVGAVALLVVRPGRAAGPDLSTEAQDFVTLTLSIVVEAMPFVILGALVSAAIRVWVPTERVLSLLPRCPSLRRVFISFFGMFMPVCECGNVPVARGSTSGPRVRHVAAQNEGEDGPGILDQRLTFSFDRPIESGDVAAAVEVAQKTRHTVTGRGQQVTVSFDQNLFSDTAYVVTVGPDLEDGTGTRMDRAYTHEFRTGEPSFTYLERNYGPGTLDEIVEYAPGSGEGRTLFQEDRISRFDRNEDYLVVAISRERADELRLVPTGPGEEEGIELPSGARVTDLEFSPADEGFVFLSEPDGASGDDRGKLYRYDVSGGRAYPVQAPEGEDGFTDALYSHDGQALLYGTPDGSYYLTGATRRTLPTGLGEYESSGGFDRTNVRISFRARTGSVAVLDAVERRLLDLPLAGAGMEISTPTFLHNSDALIYRQDFLDRSADVTLSEVYVAYLDGKTERQITALYPTTFFDVPVVSLDDRYVLVESTRDRSEGDGYPRNEQPKDAFLSLYDRSKGRVVEEILGTDPVWTP